MTLTMLVPTRSRPQNAARLAQAFRETASEGAVLWFFVDHDDPEFRAYEELLSEPVPFSQSRTAMVVVPAWLCRVGPILNHYAPLIAATSFYVGFMGDDHLPRTANWDAELVGAIGTRPGVAYGNDLNKGELLPTAVVMSGDIVRTLGYMVPPGLEHLYLDDFWKALGVGVGNLAYRADVVIEHMHFTVGKSAPDATYASANSLAQYQGDERRYEEFLVHQWPGDLERLRKALGL